MQIAGVDPRWHVFDEIEVGPVIVDRYEGPLGGDPHFIRCPQFGREQEGRPLNGLVRNDNHVPIEWHRKWNVDRPDHVARVSADRLGMRRWIDDSWLIQGWGRVWSHRVGNAMAGAGEEVDWSEPEEPGTCLERLVENSR